MVPEEVWSLVMVYMQIREAHTICQTCTTLLRATKVTVKCLCRNNCSLSSGVWYGRAMVSIGTLHIHMPLGLLCLQRTLQDIAPSATCSLGHPDHLLVPRIITALEYCNVDVSVINQARASAPQLGLKRVEKPLAYSSRRLVCHFENAVVLMTQVAALRVALETAVAVFVMRIQHCIVKLGGYTYEGGGTQARVIRLELTSTNYHRSLGSRGVIIYLILDCLLHRLQAPHMQEFTLCVEEEVRAGDWIGCMNVVTFFLKHAGTTRASVYVRFNGLHRGLLGHFGLEDTVCSFLSLVPLVCNMVTLSLHFRSVSKEAVCRLGIRLMGLVSNQAITFRPVDDGIVLCVGDTNKR